MQNIHKHHIARNFNRAAHTYDLAADLQFNIGQNLIDKIKLYAVQNLMDVGVGTGSLSSTLKKHFSLSQHYYVDIAYDMLQVCQQRDEDVSIICADFDALPFADGVFDLVFSNMSLQWSLNLSATLKQLENCLAQQGILAISLFTAGTLKELNDLYPINHFYSHADILQFLNQAGLTVIETEQASYFRKYTPVADLLRFLKQTGANYVISSDSKVSSLKHRYLMAQKREIEEIFNVSYVVAQKGID
jgi:malonyl-CoA O-methyltransferase